MRARLPVRWGRGPEGPGPAGPDQVILIGFTTSATSTSRVKQTKTAATTYAAGISFATSKGPGSARRKTRARPRRTDSHRAPAMCPPSSGSRGSMLKRKRRG